jgi:hypothetical protein
VSLLEPVKLLVGEVATRRARFERETVVSFQFENRSCPSGVPIYSTVSLADDDSCCRVITVGRETELPPRTLHD